MWSLIRSSSNLRFISCILSRNLAFSPRICCSSVSSCLTLESAAVLLGLDCRAVGPAATVACALHCLAVHIVRRSAASICLDVTIDVRPLCISAHSCLQLREIFHGRWRQLFHRSRPLPLFFPTSLCYDMRCLITVVAACGSSGVSPVAELASGFARGFVREAWVRLLARKAHFDLREGAHVCSVSQFTAAAANFMVLPIEATFHYHGSIFDCVGDLSTFESDNNCRGVTILWASRASGFASLTILAWRSS